MDVLTLLNCKVLNDFFMWANSLKILNFPRGKSLTFIYF